jgi:uncharacterized protein YhaN
MKVLRLSLSAFGPFTDALLDLSEGVQGFHLVYGTNEAGKSSALRALRQFLYGIPERSTDGFLHPYGKLRIGGVLLHSDGTALAFVRRKGRTKTLYTEDDQTVLDESLLRKFIGEIDAPLFATMFGISHEDLVRGGEEIVRGAGDVGHALFAAGAGITSLRKIQQDLQNEAEALFAPSASKRPINEAFAEIRRCEASLRDAQLPGQEWEKREKALQDALVSKESAVRSIEERQRERNRLERIRDALPLIARRKELLSEFEVYADAVLVPPNFKDRRLALLVDLKVAQSQKEGAEHSIREIEKTMSELHLPENVLEGGDLIERLYRDLGSHLKAQKDRIQLATRMDILRDEAKDILLGLREDLSLEQAEDLRLKKADTARIHDLGTRYERLLIRLDEGRKNIARLSSQVGKLEQQLKECEASRPAEDLKMALEKAGADRSLEDFVRGEEKEIENALRRLEINLRKQSLWSGTLENLVELALPSPETVNRYEALFAEVREEIGRLGAAQRECDDKLSEIQAQIDAFQIAHEVPSEEDLMRARERRDKGWALVRRALEGEPAADEETDRFVKGFAQARSLVEAYEAGVHLGDEVADRLRREADRVAIKARLVSEQKAARTRADRFQEEMADREAQLKETAEAWLKLWSPAGIAPQTPREMRAWDMGLRTIAENYEKVQERRVKVDDLKARIERRRKALDLCLRSLGEPAAGVAESLSELIERSQRIIKAEEMLQNRREKLIHEKDQREDELKDAYGDIRKIEGEISEWQSQWEEAVRPLGLDRNVVPAQANAVLEELRSLFDKLKEAGGLQKRIKGIDRDEDVFSAQVHSLTDQVDPNLAKLSADQAVAELNRRLRRALEANTRLQELQSQLEGEEQNLEAARDKIEEVHSKLSVMCKEAGCSHHEELPVAEARSERKENIENELRELGTQLRKLSAGSTIEAFVEEAGRVDPDAIEGRLERIDEEISLLTEEKSRLDQTIGEEKNELAKMDGSAKAAELAEEIQRILGRLETDVEKYARLRIASVVLTQAIERYREKHQGPVLRRTNDLFSRLTLGSFQGIRAEFMDQGAPVLVGVRPDGRETVGVEGMSEGTTDQLYLALRLASLETYLEANEPMPFIVDDILIKFDDERSRAALEIMGELSRKTQVIFFTHHRRLVEIAETIMDSEILFTHDLGAVRAAG